MGGFFGAVGKRNVISDIFFGTDYHSHLGTKSGGIAAYDAERGFQREIHSIANVPFRTKFEHVFDNMRGNAAVGTINDTDPQPLLIRARVGTYAICTLGVINNKDELIDRYLTTSGGHLGAMTAGAVNSTELVAALINLKTDIVEGIRFAQDIIDGTASVIIVTSRGTLIAARDKFGRLPMLVGKRDDGMCVSFESFAYQKLGYDDHLELGPGEIAEITDSSVTTLSPPRKTKKICAFLWSYYGYPTSNYEGKNVEVMRYRNGEIMAKNDLENGTLPDDLDYVGGVPDSGTPHAIGYANGSQKPFARPFIKYAQTWLRSFMPTNQADRNEVAKMKQIPVKELISGKHLLFVDDSIVRGTQLKETVDFLYDNGASSVHMRSACPPIMFGCKYLNFSRSTGDMELITRKTILELEGEEGFNHLDEYADTSTERGKAMRRAICDKLGFATLEFQSLEGITEAIGLDQCDICTYCWNGKE